MARRAIVFGSNGPDQGKTSLRYAEDDATLLAKALAAPRCGFELIELPPSPISALAIKETIERAAEECEPDDTFLLFFSGHGFVEKGGLLLMLDRTTLDHPLRTALHAEDLVKALRFCRARNKLLLLDCCHAGMVFNDSRIKDAPGSEMTEIIGDIKSAADTGSETFVILMASDRLESARELDELHGSFFTHSLVEAIESKFTDADEDRDGAIDLDDLKRWLEKRAREQNQSSPTLRVPIPFVYGRSRGRFYLTVEPRVWVPHTIGDVAGVEIVVLPAITGDRAWCIGKTPVTNAQYRKFTEATGHRAPRGQRFVRGKMLGKGGWKGPFEPWNDPLFSDDDKPVVCVDLEDSESYCSWLDAISKHRREYTIPSAQIWDMAAFGHPYPVHDRRAWSQPVVHQSAKAPIGTNSGSKRSNLFGVIDMLGNVWEWCVRGRDPRPHLAFSGEDQWAIQEIRGGSYLDDLSAIEPFLSVSSIPDGVNCRHSDLGFRMAGTVAIDELPREVSERIRLVGVDIINTGRRLPVTA